jgi:hypothetical protein
LKLIHSFLTQFKWKIMWGITREAILASALHAQKHVVPLIVSQQTTFKLDSSRRQVCSPAVGGIHFFHLHPGLDTHPILDGGFCQLTLDGFSHIIWILK